MTLPLNYKSLLLLPWLTINGCINLQAQSTLSKPTRAFVETGGFMVSGSVPFWLRANQYGIVPLKGSIGTIRVGLLGGYSRGVPGDSLAKVKKLDWGYGFELVGNAGQSPSLLLPEAYVKARWGQLEFYAGRRRDPIGLVDTVLTSGSYAWSGNALPIPKIQLGTLGFVSLPFTKGLFAVNALYNHGWFENANKRVTNTRLHQAALYVRFGKPNWTIKLYGGINHQVVWGGYSSVLANGISNNGYLPSSLKAYMYVVTALPASSMATDPNVSSFDETNRIGNHLGSVDVGAEINWPIGRFLVYRQNPYDTGAIVYLTTIADGLNGISFRRHQPGMGWFSVDGAVLEWLYTKSQGGPEFVITDPQRRGKVNYFDNEQFVDGWQYYGRGIGTPFLTPQSEVNSHLPVSYPIANNRVSLWHIGLSGRLARQINWLTKLSYSRNYGTYDIPYPAGTNQFSALITLATPLQIPVLGEFQLTASFAIDTGKLLTNSSGGYIGLRKTFANKAQYTASKSTLTKPSGQPMLRVP